jgi:hypothetical protein
MTTTSQIVKNRTEREFYERRKVLEFISTMKVVQNAFHDDLYLRKSQDIRLQVRSYNQSKKVMESQQPNYITALRPDDVLFGRGPNIVR